MREVILTRTLTHWKPYKVGFTRELTLVRPVHAAEP